MGKGSSALLLGQARAYGFIKIIRYESLPAVARPIYLLASPERTARVCVCVWYGTQENRKCAKMEKKGRKIGRCFLFRLVLFLLGVSSFLIFFLSKTSRVEIDVSAVVVEEDGRRPDSYDKDVPYPKRKGKEKGKKGKMRRLCWLLRVLL